MLTVRYRVPTTAIPNPPSEIAVVQVNAPFEFVVIQNESIGLYVRFPGCSPYLPALVTTLIVYFAFAGLPGNDGVLDYELLSVEPL